MNLINLLGFNVPASNNNFPYSGISLGQGFWSGTNINQGSFQQPKTPPVLSSASFQTALRNFIWRKK